jgi:DNA topoisomerase-6 subunit B
MSETFQEISPADFFYRNRDLAGFNNPSRALYAAIRELVENSLDACELYTIPPDIYLRLSLEGQSEDDEGGNIYRIRIMDNGSGIPPEFVPSAFGQILFGSKYTLRQVRGTFGLGGKMAILYGQITTHGVATIISSTGTVPLSDIIAKTDLNPAKNRIELRLDPDQLQSRGIDTTVLKRTVKLPKCRVQVNRKTISITPTKRKTDLRKLANAISTIDVPVMINEFDISIDIQRNKPRIQSARLRPNKQHWHGTIVEFTLEGNYSRAMGKILDYLKQTAMVNPYADLTFVDPRGRLYHFDRVTKQMPIPPKETLPHPHGCDVETLQRMINTTKSTSMMKFMNTHFHRVGNATARAFLKSAGISQKKNPKKLTPEDIVVLVRQMKRFESFLPPDASCLSPLGEDLLAAGIRKELNPDFLYVERRNPMAYSGYPFIVEIAIAYGGNIPSSSDISLYRFANRIPLLYDEGSDVSRKVIKEEVNWRYYKISTDMPVAIISHICSTKVPYKTVGKEYIADRPEVEREIKNGIRISARRLSAFLSKKMAIRHEKRRIDLFAKYLPQIAEFSTTLAGKQKVPDIDPLLKNLMRYGSQEA